MKILVVDDEPSMTFSMMQILKLPRASYGIWNERLRSSLRTYRIPVR